VFRMGDAPGNDADTSSRIIADLPLLQGYWLGAPQPLLRMAFQAWYRDSNMNCRGKQVLHTDRTVAFITLFAVSAIMLSGCGAKKVAGKTYISDEGDTIEFRTDGKAIETNWNLQVLYPGQQAALGTTIITNTTGGDFKLAGAKFVAPDCSYAQDHDQVGITCAGRKKTTFTITGDDSMTGPPEGMWAHPAFSHLVPKE